MKMKMISKFFLAILFIAVGLKSYGSEYFCPSKITVSFSGTGETKEYTFSKSFWENWSGSFEYIVNDTIGGRELKIYVTDYMGYNQQDFGVSCGSTIGGYLEIRDNFGRDSASQTFNSWYPEQNWYTLTMTLSQPYRLLISNPTTAAVYMDGTRIYAAQSAFGSKKNPSFSVTKPQGEQYEDMDYGLKDTSNNRLIVNSLDGYSYSGTLLGSYTVVENTLRRDSPSWVYDDIKGTGENPLYSKSEDDETNPHPLIYGFPYQALPTNIQVMTEWVFDQSKYGDYSAPKAYVNGDCKCASHSTTHIIDYNILDTDNWSYDGATHTWSIDFTMTITLGTHNYGTVDNPDIRTAEGGQCIYRCWDYGYGNTYNDAPENKRASTTGNENTEAKFTYKINKWTGKRTLVLYGSD